MKSDFFNNSRVVLRRHSRILLYLLMTAASISIVIIDNGEISVFSLIPICSGFLFLRETFRLALDFLESVFDISALTRARAKYHNTREERVKHHAAAEKIQKNFLMPYASGSPLTMPGMMHSHMTKEST